MRKKARTLVTVIAFTGAVVGALAVVEHLQAQAAEARFQTQLQRAIALKLPMTYDELRSRVRVPEGENVAPVVLKAAQSLGETSKDSSFGAFDAALRGDSKPADWAKAETHYAPLIPIVQPLLALPPNPNFAVNRPYEQGYQMNYGEVGNLRRLSQTLSFGAARAARQGNFESARRHIAASFAVADCLYQEPLLIGRLVAFGSEMRTLQEVVRLGQAHPSLGPTLRELVAKRQGPKDGQRPFWLEVVTLINVTTGVDPVLQNPQHLGMQGPPSTGEIWPNVMADLQWRIDTERMKMASVRFDAGTRALDMTLTRIELADDYYQDPVAGEAKLSIVNSRHFDGSLAGRLAAMLAGYQGYHLSMSSIPHRRSMTLAALEVMETGKTPTIKDRNGRPFELRKEGQDWVISSVGPDGVRNERSTDPNAPSVSSLKADPVLRFGPTGVKYREE